jgi:hypothetical protein
MPSTVWYQFQVSSIESSGEEPSFPATIANDKWAHFLMTWDASGETGTLSVNKISMPAYVTTIGMELVDISSDTTRPYAPIMVPWTETPRFVGALVHYGDAPSGEASDVTIGPADPLLANHMISLAHLWISTSAIITDPAKFVGSDDRPAPLEADYAVDVAGTKIRPDFYFAGGPGAFVLNKAGGGATTLIGDAPIAEPAPVKIGE